MLEKVAWIRHLLMAVDGRLGGHVDAAGGTADGQRPVRGTHMQAKGVLHGGAESGSAHVAEANIGSPA